MASAESRLPVPKTYKLYIGGKFPRSESGRYLTATAPGGRGQRLADYCRASRKDLRDAVRAAREAQPGWAGASAYLNDPKWKGKIAVFEPTRPGPGSNTISYLMKLHGEQFVKDLFFVQKAKRTRNRRQLVNWVVQEKYPIALAISITEVARLRREGFKIRFIQPKDLVPPEGPASGVMVLMKDAPHPKAAQLFLNWITTKEGMQLYTDLEGAPGTRIDLDTSKLLVPETIPDPNKKYFDTADWTYVTTESRTLFKKLKKMLGGGKSRKRKRK